MLLHRLVALPAPSSLATYKLVSAIVDPASHSCWRLAPSTQYLWPPSKRRLQIATSLGSQTSEPQPAPPRNAGVPDTSIAGGIPQVNDIIPPRSAEPHIFPSNIPGKHGPPMSLPEGEAQTSKPTNSNNPPIPAPSPLPPPLSEKPKRSKLRARKAAITLTPSATAQLRSLLSQPSPRLIRVGVKNRGCSGLAYSLEYVAKPGPFDEAVEQDGVKVLIDSKALFSIIGSEMDWVEDKLNQRFIFKNPNIKEQCGCGESFMV